jgi:hypothetical protein
MPYVILRGRHFHIIVLNVHTLTEDKIDVVKDSFYEDLEWVFGEFPKYLKKILFGDLNARVGMEDIFKPTIGNEPLHEISNDNGLRVVIFATPKNLNQIYHVSTYNIHKHTWTSPDGKTHNQIDHILIGRRRHSSILDVRFSRAEDSNNNHCLWQKLGRY